MCTVQYFIAIMKKFLVENRNPKKIFHCTPNQLKNKVKEDLKLQKSFHLQVYADDFNEWVELDLENLPPNPRLKVIIGKKFLCNCNKWLWPSSLIN